MHPSPRSSFNSSPYNHHLHTIMSIEFADRTVSYNRFLNDVAERVASLLREDAPDYICQREAYRRFGRANVDRWRRQLKIEPCKRPGKVEYPLKILRQLQATQQDYF